MQRVWTSTSIADFLFSSSTSGVRCTPFGKHQIGEKPSIVSSESYFPSGQKHWDGVVLAMGLAMPLGQFGQSASSSALRNRPEGQSRQAVWSSF